MAHEIKTIDSFTVRGKSGVFTYADSSGIMGLWSDIAEKLHHIPGANLEATYGVIYDSKPEQQSYSYLAGIGVDPSVPDTMDLTTYTVGAGKYAVFTYDGHIKDFPNWIMELWQKTIPESGIALRDGDVFERYDQRWNPETSSGPVDVYVAID